MNQKDKKLNIPAVSKLMLQIKLQEYKTIKITTNKKSFWKQSTTSDNNNKQKHLKTKYAKKDLERNVKDIRVKLHLC